MKNNSKMILGFIAIVIVGLLVINYAIPLEYYYKHEDKDLIGKWVCQTEDLNVEFELDGKGSWSGDSYGSFTYEIRFSGEDTYIIFNPGAEDEVMSKYYIEDGTLHLYNVYVWNFNYMVFEKCGVCG